MRRPGPSPYQAFVHQLSNGRWVVAEWYAQQGLWVAPVTQRERNRYGEGDLQGKRLDDLICPSYASAEGAFRRAHRLWDKARG